MFRDLYVYNTYNYTHILMQYNMQSYAHVLYIRIIYNIIYIYIDCRTRTTAEHQLVSNVHGNAVLLRMVHFPTSLCPIDLIREWKINHLEHKMFRNANQQRVQLVTTGSVRAYRHILPWFRAGVYWSFLNWSMR